MTAGVARQTQYQQTHYIRRTLNFNDSDIAAAYIGTLPAGSVVTGITANIQTAFNAGTTNPITIGTNSTSYNNLMASASITSATIGSYAGVPATFGAVAFAADTDVFATYIPTGGAATAGVANLIVHYAPNNDR